MPLSVHDPYHEQFIGEVKPIITAHSGRIPNILHYYETASEEDIEWLHHNMSLHRLISTADADLRNIYFKKKQIVFDIEVKTVQRGEDICVPAYTLAKLITLNSRLGMETMYCCWSGIQPKEPGGPPRDYQVGFWATRDIVPFVDALFISDRFTPDKQQRIFNHLKQTFSVAKQAPTERQYGVGSGYPFARIPRHVAEREFQHWKDVIHNRLYKGPNQGLE
jgi:hypothetical protein